MSQIVGQSLSELGELTVRIAVQGAVISALARSPALDLGRQAIRVFVDVELDGHVLG